MHPHADLTGRRKAAEIPPNRSLRRLHEGGAPDLLQRLAETYLWPGVKYPPMPDPPPGYVTHVAVERVAGIGPWA